ncbi:hypothetical protein FRB96_007643 [Tulasnella sp. 330]|nr:hypothetical protein FRB96_007643 [Tulasnella sp. 330]KAG8880173.1 hypothetical protein FRB97_001004 [Tulasnella sp. 331]
MRTPIDQIKGNATDARKTLLNDTMARFNLPGYYCHDIMNRMVIVEAGAVDSPNANDEGMSGSGNKTVIRAVYELKVERDMCNPTGNFHGGCVAYLVDVCTSVSYCLHDDWDCNHVSMSLETLYHAPAVEGSTIRIVCTLTAMGGRVGTSRCEIWGKEHGKLVASASHMKMKAGKPKPKAKL